MSLRHDGPLHYEFIAGRPEGRQWRVADENDDVVCDFSSEAQAQVCVRAYNLTLRQTPATWRYG